MDFSTALVALKAGHKVRRSGDDWRISSSGDKELSSTSQAGEVRGWLPTIDDLFATDWELAD